ncbi:hypothetical protein F5B20DRAFT_590649 [Whalleya microplaca]|nr:hypothetical protein F5B20DRAFT_590649 [Whalleya microplaca]
MESSPLIKAHDHARAASTATQTADTTVAINEHTKAAGEFSNAAKSTTSVEALRTLKLLEQHHERLSELLQLPHRNPASQPASENGSQPDEKEGSAPGVAPVASSTKPDTAGTPNEKNAQPMPTLSRQQRYPPRDLGASIANNLASARGIRSKYRSQPLSPSVSNTEAPGNMEIASRRTGPRTKMQNMLESSERPSTITSPERERISRQSSSSSQDGISGNQPVQNPSSPSDEGFSRFYSAFGSIINRISAPLAFAGLPLISEEQSEEPAPPVQEPPAQKRNRLKGPPSVSAEPDLKKLYSRAALKAVSRDGQSTNDSFYVVPTSGHTASYASILTFADKEKRRHMEASVHSDKGKLVGGGEDAGGDDDDFVDAKESQMPFHPYQHQHHQKKRASRSSRTDRDLANVVEELYLENKSLKDMLDKLSKRLHAFESMSQNSGMRLAESMRLMRPGSPLTTPTPPPPPPSSSLSKTPSTLGGGGVGAGGVGDEALARRNRELEDQLLAMQRQMEDTEKNYNKARANLVRYREKWDQLKAGAKARRAGGAGGGGGGGGGSSAEAVAAAAAGDESLRSPKLV